MNTFWSTRAGWELQKSIENIAREMGRQQYVVTAKSFLELKKNITEAVQKGHKYVAYFEPATEDDEYTAILQK